MALVLASLVCMTRVLQMLVIIHEVHLDTFTVIIMLQIEGD